MHEGGVGCQVGVDGALWGSALWFTGADCNGASGADLLHIWNVTGFPPNFQSTGQRFPHVSIDRSVRAFRGCIRIIPS
jgi:hypothetical protein